MTNVPAMFGLVVIIVAHLIAILGYLIMPDQSPKVDEGMREIEKQAPGFKVTLLKELRTKIPKEVGWFHKMLYGQESKYKILPVLKYEIDKENMLVKYVVFEEIDTARGESIDKLPVLEKNLIKMVRKTYIGKSTKLGKNHHLPYVINKDHVTYLDTENNPQVVSKADLVEEFEKDFVEKRTYKLGTDKSGRDLLSRLMFGTRISLSIGFISVLISMLIGITLGAFAGFFGGWVDSLITWLMTVIWSVPAIMLVVAISLALGKGVWVAFVAVGLTMWVDVARVVRGQILSVKEKLFVEAARSLGVRTSRIIFKHILPNIMGPMIVIGTANFAAAILIEAGLSFLGYGAEIPIPSWGRMVYEGWVDTFGNNSGEWYLLLYPALCICVLVLAFNLFGTGLRDAYDPKTLLKK